ncbi:Gfo/Idh/MocA family protein [Actinophytocola algeriensis]|uniref:Putative dehydrogenase n=1 Tax=Actinophytocola algeriensis TaxID=1768010 RepID=A0A7W7QDA0_9PSEU|nr:Gfo/Idh/MocA family oxidoreductase [Actinophytocola algeriensis]MBB4911303.1 putative dehydrogenase [Actinophytocola algeriensis]MBE1479242.1 putative dehydrogenase [Actinophytocola algeriensis]
MERARTNVAVVGYGYWGAHHVRVLNRIPGVSVTVVEIDSDRSRDAADIYPAIRCVTSLDEVLADVDCVVVATPPHEHYSVALKALRSKKHVLVEKPFTTSVESANRLVATADSANVHVMAGHTFEYHTAAQKLRSIISSGELGRILYIDSARLGLGKYQSDIDVVWDLAPHDVSIISFLLGGEQPTSVSAWTRSNIAGQPIDLAYLRLDFERTDAVAFINVSWISPVKVRRVTVVGDRKMAVYDYLSTIEPIRIYETNVEVCATSLDVMRSEQSVKYNSDGVVSPMIPFIEPLISQDTHFISCVKTGMRPSTPGEDGVANVRVLAGLEVAHRSGQRVALTGEE